MRRRSIRLGGKAGILREMV